LVHEVIGAVLSNPVTVALHNHVKPLEASTYQITTKFSLVTNPVI
jgi:hypothetical protein